MEKPWFKNYPEHLPRELDTSKYDSLLDMFDNAV
ncbi:acyl-CoA synthase, partial [Pasteurella multocida]|nr:acyl-CoA synthase [Pasteurella multocida]